jgi:hypothetical protein
VKHENEPSTSIETPRFYSLRQCTKQIPIKQEPELIELTDTEDEEDILSSSTTNNNQSGIKNELKRKDLEKSNADVKSCKSGLYSEWNLNSEDFEVMNQEILKQSQDLKCEESSKFEINYIRMGGFTNYSKSDLQFDKDGLRVNTTSNHLSFIFYFTLF